jgi:hypothetical protein
VLVAAALAQALIVLPGRARYEWRIAREREPSPVNVIAPLRTYFRSTAFFARAAEMIPPRASYAVYDAGDALRLAAPYVLLPRRQVAVDRARWILSTGGAPPELARRIVKRTPLGEGIELLEVGG